MKRALDGVTWMPPLGHHPVRPPGVEAARVERVIVTESVRGAGVVPDPIRRIKQYWDFEGNLLAEDDPEVTCALEKVKDWAARGDGFGESPRGEDAAAGYAQAADEVARILGGIHARR